MSLYDDFLKTKGSSPEVPTPTAPKATKPASGGGLFAQFQESKGGTVAPSPALDPEVTKAVSSLNKGEVPYEPSEKPGVAKKIWYGLGAGAKGFLQQLGTGVNEYNKFFYKTFFRGKDVFGEDYEKSYQQDKQILDKYADTTRAKLEARLGTEGADSFVTQAAEGLVQGAGQIGAFFINPVVGFTTVAAQTIGAGKNAYDEAYESSIAQGMDEKEARRIANINGIATGVINSLEIIPVGRAANFGMKLAGGSLEKGLAKTLTRVATDTLIEAGTEGAQQLGQDLTAKLTYDKDREVVKNAIRASLLAIPSGLLFAGVGEGGKRVSDKARNEALEIASVNMQNQMIQSGIAPEKAKAIADQAVAQYAVMGDEDVFDMPAEIATKQEMTPDELTQMAADVQATPTVTAEAPTVTPTDTQAKPKLTPVGGGETKTAKIAAGIEAKAIERKIQTEGFESLSESERAVMKDQRDMSEELIKSDPEQARRIALGQEEAPEGMLSSVLFQRVVKDAMDRADGALLAQLANSPLANELTAAGQLIRGAAEFRDGESAFENIKKVTKKREEIATKRLKKGETISQAKKKTVKDIETAMKAEKPKIKDWMDLVDMIEC